MISPTDLLSLAVGICLAGDRCPYKTKNQFAHHAWTGSFFMRIEPAQTVSQHRHMSVFVYVLSSGENQTSNEQ